jgi:hypothetical protein
MRVSSGRVAALSAGLCFIALTEAFLGKDMRPPFRRVVAKSPSTTQCGLFNFLNEGKKALVKGLAGDYDKVAVRDRLEGLIRDNPVLMLSFET